MNQIEKLFSDSMESDFPDKVSELVNALAGKPLNSRHLAKFSELGCGPWYFEKAYGMTHLFNEAERYARMDRKEDKGPRFRFLLGWRETGLCWAEPDGGPAGAEFRGQFGGTIKGRSFEQVNSAYFEGRRERNAKRKDLLSDPVKLEAIRQAVNAYGNALSALKEAEAGFESTLGSWIDVPEFFELKALSESAAGVKYNKEA